MTTFEDVRARLDGTTGWLTDDQARVLFTASQQVPAGGTAVEIGTHHGRSAIALASGLADGARLVAVDPFGADWRYGGNDTEAVCRANLDRAGVADVVDLVVATSAATRASWSGPVDLLYVDGKHDVGSLLDDLRWAEHLRPGGTVLVHDAFGSVGVTLGLLWTLGTGHRLRYLRRTGSLATLEVGSPRLADRLRPWRELPWFARNVLVKVSLRLRLRPLARLLGHTGVADPF